MSTPDPLDCDALQSLTDERLVKICVDELPELIRAYKVLISRYEGIIYNTCYKLLDNAEDAEEVTQDTLIQLFYKLHQFQGRSTFKTWLYRIVQNYCKTKMTKQIRLREKKRAYSKHSLDKTYHVDSDYSVSDSVQSVLNSLKSKEKEILILKYMSGLTIEEIADVLKIGVSASKMRLYRANDAFRSSYKRIEGHPLSPQTQS